MIQTMAYANRSELFCQYWYARIKINTVLERDLDPLDSISTPENNLPQV